LTTTARRPAGLSASESDGKCVCPETKTSKVVGSREGFIGGLLFPFRIAPICSCEASAGE
jgi:hypothetical protein